MNRLHKIINKHLFFSLKESEKLILQGKVKVNNKIITTLGFNADLNKDLISVNNEVIKNNRIKYYYFVFFKPSKVVCSKKDDFNRITIFDLLKINKKIIITLFPVGRLDYLSEGVIILTNNRAISNKILNPLFKIKKVYIIKIKGILTNELFNKMKKKISETIHFSQNDFKILKRKNSTAWVKLSLYSGKNNYLKRFFWKLKCFVLKLIRIRIGKLTSKNLILGQCKQISLNTIF